LEAKHPVREDILEELHFYDKVSRNPNFSAVTTGAVCVYPARVAEASKYLKGTNICVASVATG
jgi:deoxyribose-phosphate aldolase